MFASLRRGTATLVALAVVSFAPTAGAYCRTTTELLPASYNPAARGCYTQGLFLYWKNACVSFSINQNASKYVPYDTAKAIIDQAFARWTNATCNETGAPPGIAVSDYGPNDCSEVTYNKAAANQNNIIFRDVTWPYSDPNNTLGLTTVTFDAPTGEIYDADMEINATAGNLSTTEIVPANGYDLASVVTHEAGHFLGLAHATMATSTMYASYKPGTTALRTLSVDDIAGICAIYPNVTTRVVSRPPAGSTDATVTSTLAADSCNYDPRHGFTTECHPSTASSGGCTAAPGARPDGLAFAGALVGVGIVARRRRQRAG